MTRGERHGLRPSRSNARHDSRGFGLVVVLILIAVTSFGLSMAAQSWANDARRDREQQLLRIGQLYVQAIERYRRSSPGTDKRLPQALEELVLDTRFVGTVRHLRRLYPDPVGASGEWGLVRDDAGRIKGVFSLSEAAPLISGEVRRPGLLLQPAQRYSDWQFTVDTEK